MAPGRPRRLPAWAACDWLLAQTSMVSALGLSEIHRFDWLTAVLAWEPLERQTVVHDDNAEQRHCLVSLQNLWMF